MLKCYFNQGGICQRMNLATTEDCRCPLYRYGEPDTCAICGQPIMGHTVWFNNQVLCENCGKLIGVCQTCAERTHCDFETDSSPVPKVVQQTVKQGNMVSSFPVKNPNRTEITCKAKGCVCFDGNNGCKRDLGSCDQWKM